MPLPKNVRFEAGAAYLLKGEFAEDVPNATDEGDPNYFYTQASFSI